MKGQANRPCVALVFGTRPEIIKLSPVIRELEARRIHFELIHSNQHYSYKLDRVFFEELGLPRPSINLHVGSGEHGRQTGLALDRIEVVLKKIKPQVVIVQGDTNTALAGSLAAAKLHIPLAHIEAGLRSKDRRMPEEVNRVLSDHCSDILFAPTKAALLNLANEGIEEKKIFVTGNTVVDAIYQNLLLACKSLILSNLGLEAKSYVLSTLHRSESVDQSSVLSSIIRGLEQIRDSTGLRVVLPIHPRTKKNLRSFGIKAKNISIIEPLGYLDFLWLEKNAKLVMTDSGGVQEEACTLHVKCVTLRENTERPESIKVGANIVSGYHSDKIVKCALKMIKKRSKWKNPFGDGRSAKRIVSTIYKQYLQPA
jgi:UDP-N-acetylglucosamine 2-epimerase (non-hydrolysing)